MDYSVRFTNRFVADLTSVVSYLKDQLHAPQAASAVLDELENTVEILEQTPSIFPIDWDVSDMLGVAVQKAPIRAYRALYSVNEDEGIVHLLTLRHSSRDISTLAVDDELLL